jgi:hypothetical protein
VSELLFERVFAILKRVGHDPSVTWRKHREPSQRRRRDFQLLLAG